MYATSSATSALSAEEQRPLVVKAQMQDGRTAIDSDGKELPWIGTAADQPARFEIAPAKLAECVNLLWNQCRLDCAKRR